MEYIKIVNINTSMGEIDYKGLDVSKFIGGSQVYSEDLSFVLVATEENISILHEDVFIFSEEEYIKQRNEIKTKAKQKEISLEQKLHEIQENLVQSKTDNLITLEALAEVYEILRDKKL